MKDRLLGDFRLKAELGAGGGGTVYLAEQLSLRRDAVVKVITPKDGDTSGVERFLREARLASQLDHPFAAHVYDFGHERDGVLWLAMELVRGTPLDKIVKDQGPIALARFVPFFERLCEVIQAAHDQGIVHRDIKPANVMVLNRAGRLLPKLLDLGISRRSTDRSPIGTWPSLDIHDGDQTKTLNDGSPTEESPLSLPQLQGTWADRIVESETMDLTRAGAVVGTPQYMSPEQWADASGVDARSDLYSLTLVAYHTLTGRQPFRANSLGAMFRAHAREPLAELPPDFPSALNAVFAKGAAKKPDDRYATVIDLAVALRAASGLDVEPLTLPQLADEIRENVLSESPQPVAEAVALLESARSPRHQHEALEQVERVLARYLAALALASRERIGPGRTVDAPAVVALCQTLSTGRLTTSEWLELALELCRPFAYQRATHPIPELVAFFFPANSEKVLGEAYLTMERLLTFRVATSDSDEQLHGALARLITELGAVLLGLSFIADYPLVVLRPAPERWMGTRRAQRVAQKGAQLQGRVFAENAVIVLDAEGLPAATLSPLVQVLTPGPGLAEELFFIDGEGRHGARLVSLPGTFERQSDDVWPWFQKTVSEFKSNQGVAKANEAAPYKGLSTFTLEDADNYFGREREAEAFANRLKVSRLLAVVGPSGSGKSSFVLAGVLPLLEPGCRPWVIRPGPNPFESLRARVAAAIGRAPAELEAEGLCTVLGEGQSVLLVVDQFEELVTLCPEPLLREQFAALLVSLAEHPSGRFRVVLTLRDDFLIRIQQLVAMRERLSGSLQLISTPATDDLLRVLTEPAKRVGYGFDDPALPAKMVKEVSEYPGALALLSFTASQLWELRDRHLRQLRAQTYEALGGVGGALAHHAELTLGSMSTTEVQIVREAFRHLVTSSLTRAVMSREEVIEVLGGSTLATPVLDKLISARLLVSSEEASGDDRVEIIHEALIVSWPRLVGWLREDAETARLRDSLRASARQWGDRGRPSGLLWRKETLAEYRVWRARFGGRLTQLEQAFADASLRDEARSAMLRRGSAAVVFVSLIIGLGVLYRSNQASKASARESKQRLEQLWREQGRLAMVDNKPMEALVYSRAAKRLGGAAGGLDEVIGVAAHSLRGFEGTLAVLPGQANRVTLSDDHQWVFASSTEETRLDSLGASPHHLRWKKSCRSFAFSADSRTGVMTCGAEMVGIDLVSLRESTFPLASGFYGIRRTVAGTFVGAESGDTLHELDVDGNVRVVFQWPGAPSLRAEPSPDGTLYVFAGYSTFTPKSPPSLLAVDKSGRVTWQSKPSSDAIKNVVVDPDTFDVGIARASGKVEVYDRSHRLRWEVQVGQREVTALRFADDLILCGQSNGLLAAYDVKTGAPRYLAVAANAQINELALSDDARSVFLATADGTVPKLETSTGKLLFEHHGHRGTVKDIVTAGDRVISAGSDGTVRLWDARVPVAQRLSDDQVLLAKSTPSGTFAITEGAIVRLEPNGETKQVPRPPHDPQLVLYDAWQDRTGERYYFLNNKSIEVFEGGRLIWTVRGDLSLGAFDPERSRIAYALDPLAGVTLVDLDHDAGGATHLPPLENTVDMLLLEKTLLSSTSTDLSYIDFREPGVVKRTTMSGGSFNFLKCDRPDTFLTYGSGRLAAWSTNDLSRPLFEVNGLPSPVVSANLGLSSVAWAILGDGRLVSYDTNEGVMLSQTPLAQRVDAAAISLAQGVVFYQDGKGRLMRAPLPKVPAFLDDASLDAFIEARVPLELEGEKLVYRDHR